MLFRHPLYRDKVIIIVEGGSDVRLFRGIFHCERTQVEPIDGKKELLSAMNDLSIEYPEQVLAICDADHENLTGTAKMAEQYSVYMTDCHDAELMMMQSPALESFIYEYSTSEYIDTMKKSLFDMVLQAAYPIGILRWINYEKKLNLNFKGLNFNEFSSIDNLDVTIDMQFLVNTLLERSRLKPPFVDYTYLMSEIDIYTQRNENGIQVCCGHDVANLIAIIYRQKSISTDRNTDVKKVELALRLSYQKEYFFDTDLFDRVSRRLGKFGVSIGANANKAMHATSA
ncbi:DUF4435 domain-containing protein [Ectothiorhodospira lacustris]|uniref:DUF4435 domain-containing protein n=1 Tax=Ectothiorhodospira lacustris TaxID=2899127 RepID=UPI001EE7B1A5|nr:DUF4435 domain-containing protein [Ectothiorhodospira lacustris]MCG5511325.1 DUF4435 domain-containing protein [Ectothiorhodospira lacustris]MCG5523111.1 DUF4435 domain-containing protein [Ectothiorhodospira lacustris]